jgi:hypothetical protein
MLILISIHSLEAKEWFAAQPFEHTLILVKGSRSMENGNGDCLVS